MPRKSKSHKAKNGNQKWQLRSTNKKSQSTLLTNSDSVDHDQLLVQELVIGFEDHTIESAEDCASTPPAPEQVGDDESCIGSDLDCHAMVSTEVKTDSSGFDSDNFADCEPENYKLCLEEGRGVGIVTACGRDAGGRQFRLNTAALAQVLERGDAGALPLVLVSVAGAYRSGKSFLLDFFLRYLYAQAGEGTAGEDWLGGQEEPLRGFSWRGGCQRDTVGIVLWSQPIPVTLPTGEKVAVLLMDTQGSFDDESSLRDCSMIFALSTLLSSVQIYNVSQRITEDILHHLQLFTDYAALGGGELAALRLLLRDWSAAYEFPYGAAGGDAYLRHKLQVKEEQPQESRDIRQRLAASFESMGCFLLPHPGLKASSDSNFQGKLSEITSEFKQSLRELVPLILAPGALRVKMLGGRPLAARELPLLLKVYIDEFNANAPTPHTVLSATAKAHWLSGAAAARAAVAAGAARRALPAASLRARLADVARAACAPLAPLATRAGDPQGLADLVKELDALVDHYVEINNRKIDLTVARAKDIFESMVREFEDNSFCLHPLDLTATVAGALGAAMERFDCDVESDGGDPVRARLATELEERSEAVLDRLSVVNEANNSNAVEEACAALARELPRPCAHADDLAAAHAAAAELARTTFLEFRNKPNSHDHDEYMTQLEDRIEVYLCEHRSQNTFNNISAKNDALRLYERSLNLNNGCWRRDLLENKHEEVKELVIRQFYDQRDGPNSRVRDEFVQQIETGLAGLYDNLRRMNETINLSAVNYAYQSFCQTMDAVCRNFRIEGSELETSLLNACTAGREEFLRRRVRGHYALFDEDVYLHQLQQMMRDRFDYYREKNRESLSGLQIAGAVVAVGAAVGAAAVAGGPAAVAGGAATGAAAVARVLLPAAIGAASIAANVLRRP